MREEHEGTKHDTWSTAKSWLAGLWESYKPTNGMEVAAVVTGIMLSGLSLGLAVPMMLGSWVGYKSAKAARPPENWFRGMAKGGFAGVGVAILAATGPVGAAIGVVLGLGYLGKKLYDTHKVSQGTHQHVEQGTEMAPIKQPVHEQEKEHEQAKTHEHEQGKGQKHEPENAHKPHVTIAAHKHESSGRSRR